MRSAPMSRLRPWSKRGSVFPDLIGSPPSTTSPSMVVITCSPSAFRICTLKWICTAIDGIARQRGVSGDLVNVCF